MFHLGWPCSAPGWGHMVEGLGGTLADGRRRKTDVVATWVKTVWEARVVGDLGVEKMGLN